jgi:hypothetical protein
MPPIVRKGEIMSINELRLVHYKLGRSETGPKLTYYLTFYGVLALESQESPRPDTVSPRESNRLGGKSYELPAEELPWAGDAWDVLPRQTRRLLRHMHGREQDHIDNFVEIVWETTYENVSDGAIYTAISKANHFLETGI